MNIISNSKNNGKAELKTNSKLNHITMKLNIERIIDVGSYAIGVASCIFVLILVYLDN